MIPAPNFSKLEAEQKARVQAVKASRDAGVVSQALASLETAVRAGEPRLMPLIIDAVKARASVGEISDKLESVWGRYRN